MAVQFLRRLRLRWSVALATALGRWNWLPGRIHHVASQVLLPPPLSPDQEDRLLHNLSCGDESVRTPLIEHNLRLVVYIARKFENTGIAMEDLVSIGTIGLIKAVQTFDPRKKIKLATYASKCIENEILMYLRRVSKMRAEISMDEPLTTDFEGNELRLSDVLWAESNVNKHLDEEEERNILSHALGRLLPREKVIMELRFGLRDGQEHTQKEVADLLGISQSYISRLEKRILRKLRWEISQAEG
ncbi:MAG: RNA polymerase sporulation sigma factor SigE [Limnochordaceae bacterium]|nr:RNA polymerase sporulation sigma factor SigE [Limnochordaceae bacterium]